MAQESRESNSIQDERSYDEALHRTLSSLQVPPHQGCLRQRKNATSLSVIFSSHPANKGLRRGTTGLELPLTAAGGGMLAASLLPCWTPTGAVPLLACPSDAGPALAPSAIARLSVRPLGSAPARSTLASPRNSGRWRGPGNVSFGSSAACEICPAAPPPIAVAPETSGLGGRASFRRSSASSAAATDLYTRMDSRAVRGDRAIPSLWRARQVSAIISSSLSASFNASLQRCKNAP